MKTEQTKWYKKRKMVSFLLVLATLLCTLCSCTIGDDKPVKLRDLEFTVISEAVLPDELKSLIEERKTKEFKITYTDNDALYICVGYGEQKSGGYSIAVDDLYLTEESVYINTSLLGPSAADAAGSAASYPYIVIKTELLDKPVTFE